jgi:hypothetical protein
MPPNFTAGLVPIIQKSATPWAKWVPHTLSFRAIVENPSVAVSERKIGQSEFLNLPVPGGCKDT